MIELSNIITTKSWQSLCDYVYEAPNWVVPEGGICWVCVDEIPQFFEHIAGTGRSYIIVSSHSDYGLALQSEYPVLNDLVINARKIVKGNNSVLGYHSITIPPACNINRCYLSHKYSTRCYSYTNATFPAIPDEIKHWFLANNMVEGDSRLTNIPFGVPEDKAEKFANLENKEKKGLLYANFGDYTFERVELKKWIKQQGWITYKEQVSFDEYLDDISTHYFTLCPNGNGVDCYKTLEVIYAGGIPIVEDNATTRGLNLPLLRCRSFYSLSEQGMKTLWEHRGEDSHWDTKHNLTQLSYWQERILTKKKELLW